MKQQILFQIKQLQNSIIRHIFDDIKNNHIDSPPTLIQAEIIDYLLQNKETEIYQKDLESVLKLRRSTISGILQTMEKNNMIERIDSKTDARVKKIKLTNVAKEKQKQMKKHLEKLEQQITQNITEEELKIFDSVIEKMKKNIEIK